MALIDASRDGYQDSHSANSIVEPQFLDAIYGVDKDNKIHGRFVEDSFAISSMTIRPLRFAVIEKGQFTIGGGMLGLGFDTAEFGPPKTFGYYYPDFLDAAYNQSLIAGRSFGLYLRNSSE